MSTSANKLDYARIRNAQRKSNKSVHELKDSTNTQNNDIMNINDSTQQPDLPVQRNSLNNQSSNNQNEVTPRQNNNNRSDFLDVFKGPNFYSGNLDYVNSLIMSNNKSNTSISGRDHSAQKGKGHKRAKSSLADSSQKPKPKNNDENSEPAKKPGRILNISSFNLEAKEEQEPAAKEEKEQRGEVAIEKEEIQKANNKDTGNSISQRNPHNTPYAKDGKLFDEFFKTGGLMRKSMSLEDLRVDKKQVKGEESVTERVEVAGNNSEGLDKSGMSLSKKDFLGSLNGYIQYFDNSEAAYMKNKSAILKRYFLGHEHKGNNMLKKELETAKEETKMVKKNMEAVQKKMIEMIKVNKMLMKEMNENRLKEEAYQERIREIEEQFEKMKERKEYYKDKASQIQEQLEIERVENENNMMMLKKVMARNINHGLDSRGMVYTSHKRDKSVKENDYLRGMPQKHRNDFVLGNPLKEKKSVNGGVYYNNRYDGHQQDRSKVKGHGQGKIYDLSMISHKEDVGSTSEEFTSEHHMQSTSSVPYLDTSYQRDVFHEMYMSEITEKKLSKEEQIRYIQDKIVNLIEEEAVGSPYGYERHSSPKSISKHRHKASESNMHVYPAHRERESVYARQNYSNYSISQKPEYQLKTKTKSNNMENRVPDSALIDRYYLTNKSD